MVCIVLLFTAISVEQMVRGSRAARYFLAINSVVLVAALGHLLGLMAVGSGRHLRTNPLLDHAFYLGQVAQVALLSLSVAQRVRQVRHERELSDRLLHEVLPPSIAARLKTGETGIAEHFDSVTVLFADIVGFTPLSAHLSAERIVATLNGIFSRFDELTSRYGLEKIKTIGDCYMVVAGLPVRRTDHAQVIADMSLELLSSLASYQEEAHRAGTLPQQTQLQMRIGIHCGPVVAGVIGTRKFAYDLWGDTVNTASRMESHGEPNMIHCTQVFYQALRDRFRFSPRGELPVKGKGAMNTYFLLGRL
jgi:class 3 adenylate cyclase